jgi:hypothetical protein
MSAICIGLNVLRFGKFFMSLFSTISFVQLNISSMYP